MVEKYKQESMVEKYKQEMIAIIHTYLPGCAIYLFGSRARKTNLQGADVDLALDAGKKIDLDTLLDIKEEMEELTIPLFVDIVDLNSSNDSLKEEVQKDGIKWTD